MSWTDERIEQLRNMWEKGLTASQIADELGGVSRNAVIGKAHRLGLKSRPSPVKATEKAVKPVKAAAPKPAAPSAPRPAAPAAPLPRGAKGRTQASRSGVERGWRRSCAQARCAAHRVDRPRRLHPPGPRRPAGADPARAAAPAGAREAEPRDRRQDDLTRPQRPHLPLADGASGRARLPFLR